jgi:pimeloyl-ACP methyl ester carboxylesterase
MAPVAERLAQRGGMLEPLQTECSVEGQAAELASLLREHADLPVAIIGFSWGAWLSTIVAARWPEIARKLVLVSSPVFDESYVQSLRETRESRLSDAQREEFRSILDAFERGGEASLARLGELAFQADHYDAITGVDDDVTLDSDIYRRVWPEAAQLRAIGKLLQYAADLRCPVLAIHGDHDPSPARGVFEPLSTVVRDFRFVTLERCGHTPWLERHARDTFFSLLEDELL